VRVRAVIALIVVSIGAAMFAMAFRTGASFLYTHLFHANDVLAAFQKLPRAARFALPAAGAFIGGCITRLTSKNAGGHGVGDIMEAVVLGRVRLSIRATTSKALASFCAIVSGNSVGREGPLVQFGGSLGAFVAKVFGLSNMRTRGLVAAGTAAGFAAAYNTPIAAVLFVVEIVMGRVTIEPLVMVLVGTSISTACVRAVVGGGPIYGERTFTVTKPGELVMHALLGILAALVAVVFMRALAASEKAFAKTKLAQPWRATLGGAIVGALALAWPQVAGNGYEPLNVMLDETYPLGLVAILVVAKMFATTSSVGSGSPGGVFTPSLFIGGALGMLFGHAVARVLGTPESAGSYALVGMAAMTAATTHAPLMAAVMVFELSDDYALVLPLLLATAMATFLSRRLHPESVYTAHA
jgi:CIC family chloride channel protein